VLLLVIAGGAAVTVSNAEPTTDPDVALIVLVPAATAVANPPELMVAVPVVPEAHVMEAVRFCVLLSLYVPVAVNCCVNPATTDGFAGVTAIDCSVTVDTVSKVEPTTDPNVALMVLIPTASAEANPPAVMVAVAVEPEAHVTEAVRFCVLLSLYVPVAVSCCVIPLTTDGLVGVSAMDCKVAAVTVSTVEPTTDPDVALMELVPAASAEAKPAALIVAVAVVPEAHATEAVRFCVLLSL
jgi:hypothetical protein